MRFGSFKNVIMKMYKSMRKLIYDKPKSLHVSMLIHHVLLIGSATLLLPLSS